MNTIQLKSILFTALVLTFFMSCNKGPKVISSKEGTSPQGNSGIFTATNTNGEGSDVGQGLFTPPPSVNESLSNDFHKVVVDEILPTSRYVYLHVREGEETFWIATMKQEIIKGGTYYYRDGLLKTNFESKEYNRVFDKVYLVSKLVTENHGGNELDHTHNGAAVSTATTGKVGAKVIERKGSIKIAELVKNPKKYEGKTIQISGECTKVNPNIMGKNWIHLQDGSKNDFDLVITSNAITNVGEVVTMRAVVVLNKDFGSGYKYDLILEEGNMVE